NNKEILFAMHLYATDNRDIMPDSGWSTPAGTITCWAYGVNPQGSAVPGGAGGTPAAYQADLPGQINAIRMGQLYPSLKTEKMFVCPADKPYLPNFYDRKIQVCSYSWNGAVNGYASGVPPARITQFRPDDVLQWETDDIRAFWFNDCVNKPDEGLSARHGKGATLG